MSYAPAPNAAIADRSRWRRHLKTDSPAWWTWAVLSVLLIGALGGLDGARGLALLVAAGQGLVYLVRHRRLSHFPTQVRLAYLLWMAASFVPGLAVLVWIQAAGTTAMVTVGYCPLARLLLFLPANRSVPLTAQRARMIVLHPPTAGSVRDALNL